MPQFSLALPDMDVSDFTSMTKLGKRNFCVCRYGVSTWLGCASAADVLITFTMCTKLHYAKNDSELQQANS